jgi:hypothetical protein
MFESCSTRGIGVNEVLDSLHGQLRSESTFSGRFQMALNAYQAVEHFPLNYSASALDYPAARDETFRKFLHELFPIGGWQQGSRPATPFAAQTFSL